MPETVEVGGGLEFVGGVRLNFFLNCRNHFAAANWAELEEAVVLRLARLQKLGRVEPLVSAKAELVLQFVVKKQPLVRSLLVCRLRLTQFKVRGDRRNDAGEYADRGRAGNYVLLNFWVAF